MDAGFRIFRSLEEAAAFGPCALSIGNFDGVHAGHRRILRRVVELARQRGWVAAALTFDPHPAQVVAPERAPLMLSSLEERCLLMREEGIEQVLILPFDRELAALSPEAFARNILRDKLDARAVLVGQNFRFGYQQAGDSQTLAALGERLGFLTEVLPPVRVRGRAVSSSEIRRLIQAGAVAAACRLLERPYSLSGEVIPGRGIGSAVTVPTLNMDPPPKLLPAPGVYITRTASLPEEQRRPSITNVGYRPTFGAGRLTIETFLLETFSARPNAIRVEFLRRVREERKFADAAALREQILRDIHRARVFFRRLRRWAGRAPV